jgi:hypothetical protein
MSNAINFCIFESRQVQRQIAALLGCAGLVLAGAMPLQAAEELAPLKIVLPKAAFVGTKVDVQVGPNVEPLQTNRAPFMAPKDVVNLAAGKKVTCSDANVMPDKLARIVDGDKKCDPDSIVLIRKGVQWVQIDLGQTSEVFAALIWHAHDTIKVYHNVVVQLSDKEDFSDSCVTLFNNDTDNSAGRGVGSDKEYFETNLGKLIDAKGAKGRYIRFYSKGNTESKMNEYTEIEVFGRAAK